MDNPTDTAPLRVAYFFTRFPHPTETFLQREVQAMRRLGLAPLLFSWHRGGAEFEGVPVRRFSKWRLFGLPWHAVREWYLHPEAVNHLARALFLRWPRDWLNHWENLYGAGIAVVVAAEFRRERIEHLHAAWASLPAMVAWTLSRLTKIPFSIGAHAYDVFEHGGDWFLREKCAAAKFVHTSTAAARRQLVTLGVDPSRILLVRRGLDGLPAPRAVREQRKPLRVVCVARLVEKKGLPRQLAIYRAACDAGLDLSVRIIGDGPLREAVAAEITAARLGHCVTLLGALPVEAVWRELTAADVLVHTGVVAASGDRDGLPNVVPEAMAAGAVVITAPADGVLEAVTPEVTGLVCPLEDAEAWCTALRRVQSDDALVAKLQAGARRWVEENFRAIPNAARILALWRPDRA
jgi:glycosyltransferase involved in cell wall biosynthesis